MTCTSVPMENLLSQMHEKQSVLNGWAAALSLSEASVNQITGSQWRSVQQTPIVWFSKIQKGPKPHVRVIQAFLHLDSPGISLLEEVAQLAVSQAVLGARLQSGVLEVDESFDPQACSEGIQDQPVIWDAPVDFQPGSLSFEGTVPLRILQEEGASSQYSLSLIFGQGSFQLQGSCGEYEGFLQEALPRWFAANAVQPRLLTLDFGPTGLLPFVRASSFQLATEVSDHHGRILQILLPSLDGAPDCQKIALHNPIPVGMHYSIIFSSRTFFENVVTGYNGGRGDIKLTIMQADMNPDYWYSRVRSPMQYQGSISCKNCPDIENQAELGFEFKGSDQGDLSLSTYVSPGANIQLELSMTADFEIKTIGDGDREDVYFQAKNMAVQANGLAETAVQPLLERFLHQDIKTDMTAVSFAEAGDLLQNNLSFPGQKLSITSAHLPGDFLVVGTLEEVNS